MARKIQSLSSSSQAGLKSFLRLLANAIFWLIMAALVPVQAFLHMIPEIAPYAHWAPLLFYGLAIVSFVRAIRILQLIAAGQRSGSAKGRPSGGASSPTGRRGAKATTADRGMPAITREPTVQRMR
jgi:hypothetical protein